MSEKIVVGPFNKGLRNDKTAFNIDNDSFPTLINAYQWRGRVKRKRGTKLLNRLKRFFNSLSTSYNSGSTTITLSGAGAGNILTGFSLQTNGNIVPGSVTIHATVSAIDYTDPSQNGTLSPSGSINYATGAITIAAEAGQTVSVTYNYYPDLPVMGLEEFIRSTSQFADAIGFDNKYSYNILNTTPFNIYDVSFYKNLDTATYVGYTRKTNSTPVSWNGQDYQQFWTTNYQGAMWASNGIDIPFTGTGISMQFKSITGITVTAGGPPATATLTIVGHGLVRGDFVFINEVAFTDGVSGISGINLQTGYVVSADPQAANTVEVEFPNATISAVGGGYTSGGIAQYLTNRSDITKDCLRFYDGDPTDGNATSPTLNGNKGWVNFCPPVSVSSYSVSSLPAAQYYLVGARQIVPFKDRLLFFGPAVQTSSGNPIYLKDTVIYSQNGTPYYTASFTLIDSNGTPATDPSLVLAANISFNPILVPSNQTASAVAYVEDSAGFGGFQTAGIDEPINTVSINEDALMLGFEGNQVRLVYTGNDFVPFNFFIINSELGSSSTFSAINLDKGVITRGSKGFVISSQTQVDRIDLEIPDIVFESNLTNNGSERVTAYRDYINEWIYFTFPYNQISSKFPNTTLQFNYRDNSWSLFTESYTHYGSFKKQDGFTWQTVGATFPTWSEWNESWNSGSSTILQPLVIAGNQQGFVLIRDEGTSEGNSLYIRDISSGTVTSPSHSLNENDYIIINGCLGTISDDVNGKIFSVNIVDNDSFILDPPVPSGTYLGGGVIKRMYVPYVQTKQFPVAWNIGRKTRIGAQQYLFSTTANGQIQLLIFLSQNADSPYNDGPIVPSTNVTNNALVYSTVLYTCPESTNLGLTPANMNLQTPTAVQQAQTWHRMNTSLIGDTVQIGFTLSDEQMRSLSASSATYSITAATQANPCVLTTTAAYSAGQMVRITGVVGMTELNDKVYQVITSDPTTVTIDVNASAFTAYSSGGSIVGVAPNQFAEIELHGFILDATPSQVLV